MRTAFDNRVTVRDRNWSKNLTSKFSLFFNSFSAAAAGPATATAAAADTLNFSSAASISVLPISDYCISAIALI